MAEFIELNNGNKMPRVGLGTWKAPAEKTKQAVITAIKSGYRFIDCANDYDNEHVIGEALQGTDNFIFSNKNVYYCIYIEQCQ